MAEEKDDPVVQAMRQVIEVVKAAVKAAPSPETEFNLIDGLLDVTATFAAAFGMPHFMTALMFAHALEVGDERIERVKASLTTPAPTASEAVPTPKTALTPDQVREILARMKEGGRVN